MWRKETTVKSKSTRLGTDCLFDTDVLLRICVNLLTAFGAGLAAVSIPLAFQGWMRTAWMVMGLGMLIDWLDGSLVRFLDLPADLTDYDGARLDEYADLVIYVVAPVSAAWADGLLPPGFLGYGVGLFVCLVSLLHFAREKAKTDRAFWGWPCYWNFLYFYGWGLEMSTGTIMILSVGFGLATFAPVPFPYPSRFSVQKYLTILLGTLWGVLITTFLLVPSLPKYYLVLSLVFPVYYLALSLFYYERFVDG